MKRFIFILIAFCTTLLVSAQYAYTTGQTNHSVYVAQQHVDVGTVYQTNYNYNPPVVNYNTGYSSTNTSTSYQGYTTDRRGVGLNEASRNIINNLKQELQAAMPQDNYRNVERYERNVNVYNPYNR